MVLQFRARNRKKNTKTSCYFYFVFCLKLVQFLLHSFKFLSFRILKLKSIIKADTKVKPYDAVKLPFFGVFSVICRRELPV